MQVQKMVVVNSRKMVLRALFKIVLQEFDNSIVKTNSIQLPSFQMNK